MIVLSVKNKLGFIDGTLTKPSVTNANHKARKGFNDIIISYILRSLEAPNAKSVNS